MHQLCCATIRTSLRLCLGMTVCAVLLSVGTTGCYKKVEMKPVDMTGGVAQPDRDKIKKYLEDAGINGEIVSTTEDGNTWVVEVGSPKPKDGGRKMPVPPDPYRIDKTTGKIVEGLAPGKTQGAD